VVSAGEKTTKFFIEQSSSLVLHIDSLGRFGATCLALFYFHGNSHSLGIRVIVVLDKLLNRVWCFNSLLVNSSIQTPIRRDVVEFPPPAKVLAYALLE
jgi:hypothetical protein